MKQLYAALFFCLGVSAQAQLKDTVELTNGKILIGAIGDVYKNYFYICKWEGNCSTVYNNKVKAVVINTRVVNYEHNPMIDSALREYAKRQPPTTVLLKEKIDHAMKFDTLQLLFKRTEWGGTEIKKAGGFGLIGVGITIAGAGLMVGAALAGKPSFAYAGAVVSGVGLSLNIISLVKLMQGGDRLKSRDFKN